MNRLQYSYVISPTQLTKICSVCKEEKSLDEFNLAGRKLKRKDGIPYISYVTLCCDCQKQQKRMSYKLNKKGRNKRRKKIRELNKEEINAKQRDRYTKQRDRYTKDKKYRKKCDESRGNWQKENKEYLKKYNKEYRLENPDKVKGWSHKSYWKHRDERIIYGHEYCAKNKDKIKKYQQQEEIKERANKRAREKRANRTLEEIEIDKIKEKKKRNLNKKAIKITNSNYYENNKPKVKKRCKKYYEKNPNIYVAVSNKRRKLIKDNGPSDITSEYIIVIKAITMGLGKCPLCGRKITKTKDCHLEHATPLTRGGAHAINNVYCCCGKCNFKKSTFTLSEFIHMPLNDLIQTHINREWDYLKFKKEKSYIK